MGTPKHPYTCHWSFVQTLGAILDDGTIRITARCSGCGNNREVDVAALAEKVGRDYSLVNRRSRHRGCPNQGWYSFKWSNGTWSWPMQDEGVSLRWMLAG